LYIFKSIYHSHYF